MNVGRRVLLPLLALMLLAACAVAPATAPAPSPRPSAQPAPLTAAQEAAALKYRAQVHTDLAVGYYGRAQYGVALDELKEALRVMPDYVPALSVRGLVYMDLHDDDAASASFNAALRVAPKDAEVNNNYGWFLCNRGRPAESLKHFSVAMRDPLYRTPEKSLANAGICALRAHDEPTAEDFLQRALKLRPDEPQAAVALAGLSFSRQQFALARGQLQPLMQSANPGPAAVLLAARIARHLGDPVAEKSYVQGLQQRYPNSIEAKAIVNGESE